MKKVLFLSSLLVISVLAVSMVMAFWPFSSGITGAAIGKELVPGLYPNTRVTAISCTPSDTGISYVYKSGFSTSSKTKTNGCSNNIETTYSCNDKTANVATKTCSNGCDSATGLCAIAPAEIWTCSDTDSGIITQTKGTATSTNEAGESTSQTDECLNTRFLREVSCAETGGAIVFNEIECNDADCDVEASTCTPKYPSCTDSDEKDGTGLQFTMAGKITTYDASGKRTIVSDACADSDTVTEQSCNGNLAATSVAHNCLIGEICELGRCIGKKCEDSDGGNVPGTRGTVISHQIIANAEQPADVTATDFCLSEKFLLEFACSATSAGTALGGTSTNNPRIVYKLTNCRGGCLEGACKQVATTTTTSTAA